MHLITQMRTLSVFRRMSTFQLSREFMLRITIDKNGALGIELLENIMI